MDFDDFFADIAPTKPAGSAQQPKQEAAPAPAGDLFADFGLDSTAPAPTTATSAPVTKGAPITLLAPSTSAKKTKKKGAKKKASTKASCQVEGCTNKEFKRGYCALHLNSEHDAQHQVLQTKKKEKQFDSWSMTRTVQQGAYFKKNVITWKFVFRDEPHVVMLKHSPVGGKRVIFVDAMKVFQEKLAGSSRHELMIGSRSETQVQCVVVVNQTVTGVDYDLEIKGGSFKDAHHIWFNSTEF